MKKISIGAVLIATFFWGCAKEGLGGDTTLVIFPQHHGRPIPSTGAYHDSVYVKFGAKEIPADPTHDYDAVFAGEVGEDHVHVEGLKRGDYSIYCTAYDDSMQHRVVGGIVTKLKRADGGTEIDKTLPVGEE